MLDKDGKPIHVISYEDFKKFFWEEEDSQSEED